MRELISLTEHLFLNLNLRKGQCEGETRAFTPVFNQWLWAKLNVAMRSWLRG